MDLPWNCWPILGLEISDEILNVTSLNRLLRVSAWWATSDEELKTVKGSNWNENKWKAMKEHLNSFDWQQHHNNVSNSGFENKLVCNVVGSDNYFKWTEAKYRTYAANKIWLIPLLEENKKEEAQL